MKNENLTIDLEKAKELFKRPESIKEALIAQFGINQLSENILDKVPTFEAAFALASKEIQKEYNDTVNENTPPHIVGEAQLIVIISVINEGWRADFENADQRKWLPIHQVLPSGVGFGRSGSVYDRSNTFVGVRLLLENEEKSNYVGKTFITQYTKMYTYNK